MDDQVCISSRVTPNGYLIKHIHVGNEYIYDICKNCEMRCILFTTDDWCKYKSVLKPIENLNLGLIDQLMDELQSYDETEFFGEVVQMKIRELCRVLVEHERYIR
ncbi:MAG: hypothetical protein EB100_05305 [Crocinitomicaceae bacterium]|nr:hypothetical protein [Crocinitomicaceae bacterium]